MANVELTEKSRINLNFIDVIGWLGSLLFIAWIVFGILSKQKELDLMQQNEIDQLKEFQKRTDAKLDLIISKQESFNNLLIKHELLIIEKDKN